MVPRMRTITGLDELKAAEGETLGTSDWHEVTQKDVDAFADVTGDHQWIHVDVERAKETPFGGTIAHGYLTLCLGPGSTTRSSSSRASRSPSTTASTRCASRRPCRSASKVRVRARSSSEIDRRPGRRPVVFEVTFEREGGDKPVCVAETSSRVYTG